MQLPDQILCKLEMYVRVMIDKHFFYLSSYITEVLHLGITLCHIYRYNLDMAWLFLYYHAAIARP